MKNIFDDIPKSIPTEIFDVLVDSNKVKIERIISKGQTSPKSGWYDQDKNEWLIVLQGEAVLAFENQPTVNLKAGDFLNIPAHQKHKVEWTRPDTETIWLAVHY